MSFDFGLWIAGLCLQIAFAGLLLFRHTHRRLPLLFAYILWDIVSDLGGMWVSQRYPHFYLRTFLVETTIDSLLQLAVLVELGWSLLRPARATLLRPGSAVLLSVLVLSAMFALPAAAGQRFAGMSTSWRFLLESQQFFSILRVLLCLVLVGCSQLLALGWRDRELQIVTGLGFYSLATLAVSFLHAQPFTAHSWHQIDQCMVMSYLACLLFWVASFVRKDAPPPVPSDSNLPTFMEMLAKSAHADRLALRTPSAAGAANDASKDA